MKMGDCLSMYRKVRGGVPQGLLIGVLLFNATIDHLELASRDIEPCGVVGGRPDWVAMLDRVADDSTDIPLREESNEEHLHRSPWQSTILLVLKYVDDNILLEKINLASSVETDANRVRERLAERMQNLFRQIIKQAGLRAC